MVESFIQQNETFIQHWSGVVQWSMHEKSGQDSPFIQEGSGQNNATHNTNITITRLVSILLRFYPVFSKLLLNSWQRNDPEPNVHLLLMESKPYLSPASCPSWLPTSLTHHIPPTVTCAQSLQEWKRLRGLTVRVLFNQTNRQTNKPLAKLSDVGVLPPTQGGGLSKDFWGS